MKLPLFAALFLALSLAVGCKHAAEPLADAVPLAPDMPAVSGAIPGTASKPGEVTTASGLRYQVLSSGPAGGRSPTRLDTVKVHYRGTLTDGTVFDSSIDRGTPATFGVGQVIPGWTEALQLMKPGDKWMLYIPSHLAYGNRAVGGKIPPNSDLIFEVQLLEIQ